MNWRLMVDHAPDHAPVVLSRPDVPGRVVEGAWYRGYGKWFATRLDGRQSQQYCNDVNRIIERPDRWMTVEEWLEETGK